MVLKLKLVKIRGYQPDKTKKSLKDDEEESNEALADEDNEQDNPVPFVIQKTTLCVQLHFNIEGLVRKQIQRSTLKWTQTEKSYAFQVDSKQKF